MAKFLNKKEQVIDFQLTPYGRQRLSVGSLKPTYYAFFDDDILYDGPFAHLAPDYVKTASRIHHMAEKILFAVIALHLLALFVYFWRLKKNLVPAMVAGRRAKASGPTGQLSGARTAVGFLLMFVLIVLFQLTPLLRPSLF